MPAGSGSLETTATWVLELPALYSSLLLKAQRTAHTGDSK